MLGMSVGTRAALSEPRRPAEPHLSGPIPMTPAENVWMYSIYKEKEREKTQRKRERERERERDWIKRGVWICTDELKTNEREGGDGERAGSGVHVTLGAVFTCCALMERKK